MVGQLAQMPCSHHGVFPHQVFTPHPMALNRPLQASCGAAKMFCQSSRRVEQPFRTGNTLTASYRPGVSHQIITAIALPARIKADRKMTATILSHS